MYSTLNVALVIFDLSLFQLGETSDKEKETQQFDMQVIINGMSHNFFNTTAFIY